MNIVYIIADFTKISDQQCIEEGSAQGIWWYQTLDEALSACSKNTSCVGIYDDGCDNENNFAICIEGISPFKDSHGCVYKKSEGFGEYENLKITTYKITFW